MKSAVFRGACAVRAVECCALDAPPPPQMELGQRVQTPVEPMVPVKPVVPELVGFVCEGESWRCARFDLLVAEFEVAEVELGELVQAAQATDRGWLVMRRLFGIQPVKVPLTVAVEDLRPWTRVELQEALGLTRKQLNAELDAVRGTWRALRPRVELPPEPVAVPETTLFTEDSLLERHGLVLKFSSSAERTWFCQRVADYEKILMVKFAQVLARNALLTELRIYQLDGLMNNAEKCAPGDTPWHMNLKVRQLLSEQYQKLLEQIKELCPWAGAVAGSYTFTGAIADICRGIQEWKSHGTTTLIDGMRTATEIIVDTRLSVQAPEPAYRADVTLRVIEARAQLWNFRAKSELKMASLRHCQQGWKTGYLAAVEADGGQIPDLTGEGPASEFVPLPTPEDLAAAATPAETKGTK